MAGIDSCFKSSSGRLNRFKTFKTRNELVRLAGARGGIGSCGRQAFRKDGTVFGCADRLLWRRLLVALLNVTIG